MSKKKKDLYLEEMNVFIKQTEHLLKSFDANIVLNKTMAKLLKRQIDFCHKAIRFEQEQKKLIR